MKTVLLLAIIVAVNVAHRTRRPMPQDNFSDCGNGWKEYKNSQNCYKVFTQRKTRQEAQSFCMYETRNETRGFTRLVYITRNLEQYFKKAFKKEVGEQLLWGVNKVREHYAGIKIPVTTGCVVLNWDKLQDSNCTSLHGFICDDYRPLG